MKKDFLTLQAYSGEEIWDMLKLARNLKDRREKRRDLEGKILAMIFQKASTRTRLSFEVAMKQLGGDAVYLGWDQIQLGRGETIADTAQVLGRYVDGIMARVFSHRDLEELAENATIPVINGLSDRFHPAQALSDLLTIWEKIGRLKDVKIAYVGDGNNVCNSLLIGASKVGTYITVASPLKYRPSIEILETALKNAEESGSSVEVIEDPAAAVAEADVVYTDTFVSMGMEEEKAERTSAFKPRYQVNAKLMASTGRSSIFMHCLPAHRGEEVVDEVIDGPASVVWDQAENRMHTQKALLSRLL